MDFKFFISFLHLAKENKTEMSEIKFILIGAAKVPFNVHFEIEMENAIFVHLYFI